MKSRLIVSAIIERNGKILLGRKPDNIGPYPNTWHLPGGGVDLGNESILEALKREAKEETGLQIVDIKSLGFDEDFEKDKHNEMTHYVFLVFSAKVKGGKVKAADDVIKLKWFDKAKLSKLPLPRPSMKLFKRIGLIQHGIIDL